MMAKPWNEHRSTITKLYIQEGRTLEDVRNIMKVQYGFEASIRSYRQHFDNWNIGKYNCKKRDQRRRRSLGKNMPLSPPHSPPGSEIKKEESGSPASSSSASYGLSEQKPLPALGQPLRYPSYFQEQVRSRTDPQVKMEGGQRPLWEGLGMFRNSHVTHDMLPSLIEEPRRPTSAVPLNSSVDHPSKIRCPGLRAPNLSVARGNGGPESIIHHHMVGYQGIAQG
ncbi:hypothetical protein FSARC_2530 [Fusarium sarcochroum]|uniref:Clr5 domain-containing protein n=1 Tax=Fusarium sarcochroum TaxID=1208366 RepID=A0A8H4U6E9_9HYPO|nr:hypothetical protein FSARC_2530 [Fusarium sarcochroum]